MVLLRNPRTYLGPKVWKKNASSWTYPKIKTDAHVKIALAFMTLVW